MINLYNANTEKEQIEVLSNLFALLKTFDINPNKHIIMAGDFNLSFNSNLDAADGKPKLKRKSLAKLIELREGYDLCDIWRVTNTKVKEFTFTQQHSSGFIQRRLDYFFLSRMVFKNMHPLQIFLLLFQQNITHCSSLFHRKKVILEVKVSGNSIAPSLETENI